MLLHWSAQTAVESTLALGSNVGQANHAAVTDANAACAFGTVPAGGGSNYCPVFCNGVQWLEQ